MSRGLLCPTLALLAIAGCGGGGEGGQEAVERLRSGGKHSCPFASQGEVLRAARATTSIKELTRGSALLVTDRDPSWVIDCVWKPREPGAPDRLVLKVARLSEEARQATYSIARDDPRATVRGAQITGPPGNALDGIGDEHIVQVRFERSAGGDLDGRFPAGTALALLDHLKPTVEERID